MRQEKEIAKLVIEGLGKVIAEQTVNIEKMNEEKTDIQGRIDISVSEILNIKEKYDL